MDSSVIWYAVLAVVVVALVFVLFNFNKVKKMKEGNDEMVEMAGIIRSGAGTFLKAEFKVIAIIGVIIALVFSLFVEATSGITFLRADEQSGLYHWYEECHLCQCTYSKQGKRITFYRRDRKSSIERWKCQWHCCTGIWYAGNVAGADHLGCGSSRNRSRTGGKPGVQSFHHENHYILSRMFNRSHVQQGCRW